MGDQPYPFAFQMVHFRPFLRIRSLYMFSLDHYIAFKLCRSFPFTFLFSVYFDKNFLRRPDSQSESFCTKLMDLNKFFLANPTLETMSCTRPCFCSSSWKRCSTPEKISVSVWRDFSSSTSVESYFFPNSVKTSFHFSLKTALFMHPYETIVSREAQENANCSLYRTLSRIVRRNFLGYCETLYSEDSRKYHVQQCFHWW